MAGNSGAIRAGGAFIEVFAEDSQLKRTLQSSLGRIKSWGSAVSAIGGKLSGLGGIGEALGDIAPGLANFTFSPGGIVTGLLAAAKGFAMMGSELNDAAQRTGFAVEELSALRFAAEQAGASFEDLENGIKFMQKGGFGTTAADFKKLADQIRALESPAARTQRAIEVFGRGGVKLLSPIIEGFGKVADEAARAGLVMTAADAAAADKLGDALDALKSSLKVIAVALGSALAPLLMDWIANIQSAVGTTVQWIKENKGLIVSVLKMSAILVGIGAALVVVGGAISGIIATVGMVGTIISTTFGLVVGAVQLVGGLFVAMLSPVGLLLGAVVGLGAVWLTVTESGQQALSGLTALWNDIAAVSKAAWGGIVDAIRAGNLKLALEIAVAGMKVVWLEMLESLGKGWNLLILNMKSMFYGVLKDFLLGSIALNRSWGLMSEKSANEQATSVIDQNAEVQRKIEENKAKEEDRTNPAIATAKKELDRLTKQAAEERQAQAAKVAEGAKKGMAGGMFDASSGGGTFSARGVGMAGPGGGGIKEAITKQTEEQKETNKLLEELIAAVEESGGVMIA